MRLYVGFLFVLDPSGKRPAVALPAGVATVALAILAWLIRRRFPPKPHKQKTPGDDVTHSAVDR